ncbi:MAG: family 20 glycosylhydrolase [Rikenellaceae bacterium]
MKKYILSAFVLLITAVGCQTPQAADNREIAITPQPVSIVATPDGSFNFSRHTQWVLPVAYDPQLAMVIEPLLEKFERAAGYKYKTTTNATTSNAVDFKIDSAIVDEGYVLEVSPELISVRASSNAGFFYALQSIAQLLPSQITSCTAVHGVKWSVPSVVIEDYPRMAYRGFMLDVSRHFTPKDDLLEMIDAIALLKLNKLHLHLVDDNGWRLEIKKYPELTSIGAWHVERPEDYPARTGPLPDEERTVGGFYTQDDMREIIAYAAARAIEVIPEIEMPAHTMSSLAAYPHLACQSEGKYIGVTPGFVGHDGYTPVYCAGKEEVFSFLEDVLCEVMELFPTKYIHVGGDEATTKYWEECPDCQARMREIGVDRARDLQGYFLNRINEVVLRHDHTMIGWDELTLSHIPENAVIIGWRGNGDCAIDGAKRGHDYVIAPNRAYYVNQIQGPQWFEPLSYTGNVTLKDVYSYDPLQSATTDEIRSHFMGVQGCMWSEFVSSTPEIYHQIFPRLYAIAERGWSQESALEWGDFLRRVDALDKHMLAAGIVPARSRFNIDHRATPVGGGVSVSLSSICDDVEIRYTLDGSEPCATSSKYSTPLLLRSSGVITAATFRAGEMEGAVLTLPIDFNLATGALVSGAEPNMDLATNGVRGIIRSIDYEWCSVYNKDVAFTLDLGESKPIESISINTIVDHNMGVAHPKSVRFLASTDGEKFVEVGVVNVAPEVSFEAAVAVRENLVERLAIAARYIKIEMANAGLMPAGNPRVGQFSKINFDEVTIR